MSVPFFDLTRQYEAIGDDIDGAVADVLTSQQCIGGPHVKALEERLAERVGCAHAVGVSSGTDALLVSLMALDIGPGDEVITTPFTFFSPVGSILRLGARPVFVDIRPDTFNLDAEALREAITSDTRAIVPVHLFGHPCDMTAIMEVAESKDIAIVEDMAQAIDARHAGRPVGSFGDTGCVSFFPTKNLGAAGDGGMVFCDDDGLARRIRRLCRHGAQPKYHHLEAGGNFRLDAIQAAILGVKLEHLQQWNERRREHAEFYHRVFADRESIVTPRVRSENQSVFNQYTVRVEGRDAVQAGLKKRNIGSNIYYPEPLHTQPALNEERGHGAFPEAERACREVLSLPIFPELSPDERRRVCDAVLEVTSR